MMELMHIGTIVSARSPGNYLRIPSSGRKKNPRRRTGGGGEVSALNAKERDASLDGATFLQIARRTNARRSSYPTTDSDLQSQIIRNTKYLAAIGKLPDFRHFVDVFSQQRRLPDGRQRYFHPQAGAPAEPSSQAGPPARTAPARPPSPQECWRPSRTGSLPDARRPWRGTRLPNTGSQSAGREPIRG